MSDALDALLETRRILRTTELHDAGFDGRRIAAAVNAGRIQRAAFSGAGEINGLYTTEAATLDEDYDACMASLMTGGVLCGQYMASRQGLATCMPDDISVLVDYASTPAARAGLSIVRTRLGRSLELGVGTRVTDLGIAVRETQPARTVVDLFRGAGGLEDDRRYAVEALVSYLAGDGTPAEVMRIAEAFSKSLPGIIEVACEFNERQATPGM